MKKVPGEQIIYLPLEGSTLNHLFHAKFTHIPQKYFAQIPFCVCDVLYCELDFHTKLPRSMECSNAQVYYRA